MRILLIAALLAAATPAQAEDWYWVNHRNMIFSSGVLKICMSTRGVSPGAQMDNVVGVGKYVQVDTYVEKATGGRVVLYKTFGEKPAAMVFADGLATCEEVHRSINAAKAAGTNRVN